MTGEKSGSAVLHYFPFHATRGGRYCNYCVYLWSQYTQIEALEGKWVPSVFLLLVINFKFLLFLLVVPMVYKGLDWHSSAHGAYSSMS